MFNCVHLKKKKNDYYQLVVTGLVAVFLTSKFLEF